MTAKITLELPDSVIKRAQAAAEVSGHPLETILTEWLEQVAVQDLETLLTSEAVHTIYTPVGSDATAEDLWKILKEFEAGNTDADKIQP